MGRFQLVMEKTTTRALQGFLQCLPTHIAIRMPPLLSAVKTDGIAFGFSDPLTRRRKTYRLDGPLTMEDLQVSK